MGARGGGGRLAVRAILAARRRKETDYEQQRIQVLRVLCDVGCIDSSLSGHDRGASRKHWHCTWHRDDTSGAVVPGVSVTLRNTENNLTYKTATEQSGEFRFLTVPAGPYELTATREGFKKVVHSAFAVHAAEPAHVNVVLQVGAISEQITTHES
jgi:Carboxypeptidase regulatory-like domain